MTDINQLLEQMKKADEPLKDFESLKTLCEWCLEVEN